VQAFCTSALHRAVVPCDSTALLFTVGCIETSVKQNHCACRSFLVHNIL